MSSLGEKPKSEEGCNVPNPTPCLLLRVPDVNSNDCPVRRILSWTEQNKVMFNDKILRGNVVFKRKTTGGVRSALDVVTVSLDAFRLFLYADYGEID